MIERIAVTSLFIGMLMLHGSGLGSGQALAAEPDLAPGAGAVTVARTTLLPACNVFVDAAAAGGGDGSAVKPHKTIVAAVEAASAGSIICVAAGTYAEEIKPGEKFFTLAGGFQPGKGFAVRDSAAYVSKAQGNGSGSFLRIQDPGPKEGLTAIDGFEITGYAQAVVRDYYESQRFDLTNNFIHDNACTDPATAGAGFAMNNVSGAIRGNVIRKNSCGRGGAGFLNDTLNKNTVLVENNFVEGNSGTEPGAAHGGALYLFGNTLRITGNMIVNNSVTQWGAGLYIGAFTAGNQPTTATITRNVYRGNRAGNGGGGFFCDDGATCNASYELYEKNCGGNVLVDGGSNGSGPTIATFDHITNVGALSPNCDAPGPGLSVDTYEAVAPDSHTVTNAIFWGNAEGRDVATACNSRCSELKVSIDHSMVQTKYADGSVKVVFGPGIVAPVDPQFVAPDKGDYRLKPGSPASGKGIPTGKDLGAYVAGAQAPPSAGVAATPTPAVTQAPAATTVKAVTPGAPSSGKPAQAAVQTAGNAAEASAAEAFAAAKELNTLEGWTAFLLNYPAGPQADLARGNIKTLIDTAATKSQAAPSQVAVPQRPPVQAAPVQPAPPLQASPPPTSPAQAAPQQQPNPGAATAAETSAPTPNTISGVATTGPKPAVTRGSQYMGFPEKFNRYYTDPLWRPSKIVYVSPDGSGDGTTIDRPMPAETAVKTARPGTKIHFVRGAYTGCFEFSKANSGTYDDPILLFAERNGDNSAGVSIACCKSGRQTCFNFEAADYIAIDGFELDGGRHGLRTVGTDFAASKHAAGIAVLGCRGQNQINDSFFAGHTDWMVWERVLAHDAKDGGHGIYISNGSDWNIVRLSETFGNGSSGLEINADPQSVCTGAGVKINDPRCDGYAGDGEGGQGASDYFLVESNFFHGDRVGPNFSSLRRSIVRNNIFGAQDRHNVTFWQDSKNPKLGSSDNKILHNLFISTGGHAVKFENNATRNEFANNVLIGVLINGGKVLPNRSALLMEVDGSTSGNIYRSNLYSAGSIVGRTLEEGEKASEDYAPGWFEAFSAAKPTSKGFTPTATAPFLNAGVLSPDAPIDRNGTARSSAVDLGPIERP